MEAAGGDNGADVDVAFWAPHTDLKPPVTFRKITGGRSSRL